MTGEDLVQQVKDGYEAFKRGDVDSAIELFSDNVKWNVPGDSAISGSFNGKEEVLGLWGKIADAGMEITNYNFLSDGENVVCALTSTKVGDDEWGTADFFTFGDGKVVRFDSIEDTAPLERAFPK